jgi:tRNA-dihydrouridine synthase A
MIMNLSIAPMLKWTDRHYRYFMRQITKNTLLYSEMVVANAVIHNHKKLLEFNTNEHPVVLQLGGSDPELLAQATKIAVDYGYDEINLNVGCPSDRVQSGKFGACLMKDPKLVADCILAMMQAAGSTPVSIKHRIGVDYNYDYLELSNFVNIVSSTGCRKFIIHARNAILQGLNPKENRTIPPLKYETVYQLKKDFPQLEIVINGGIVSLEEAQQHSHYVDGVMIGRAAYNDPYIFVLADDGLCKVTRRQVAENMVEYLSKLYGEQVRLNAVTKHMMGLYSNTRIAKVWRRSLTQIAMNNDFELYKDIVSNLSVVEE